MSRKAQKPLPKFDVGEGGDGLRCASERVNR